MEHLEQAIDEGKEGHADVATTDAKAALTHLEQVH
jgi:Small metal-binding protein